MDKRTQYKIWQAETIANGENDPEFVTLPYIADKYKLSTYERHWLSYLFSACYDDTTAWAMFKLIKDQSEEGLEKFWKTNKARLAFTTDRAKVKTFDKFVPMTLSYFQVMQNNPEKTFNTLYGVTPYDTYDNVYKHLNQIYYVGRFTLFLFTEAIYQLTKFPMLASHIPFEDAQSSANGLCYLLDLEDWIIKHGENRRLTKEQFKYLYKASAKLLEESQKEYPEVPITNWNMETFLCAYKKYFWKTRYKGFYLDRQLGSIRNAQLQFPELVNDWETFYEARSGKCDVNYLGEINGWDGIRRHMMGYPVYPVQKGLDV